APARSVSSAGPAQDPQQPEKKNASRLSASIDAGQIAALRFQASRPQPFVAMLLIRSQCPGQARRFRRPARRVLPSGAFAYFANFGRISVCDFSISLILIGLSTNNAINAAAMSSNAARKNTGCQSPVAAVNTLVKGTSSEAVPFAVYSMP